MKINITYLLLLIGICFSCTKESENKHTKVSEGNWLTVFNYTAHSNQCGSGVTVKFVLETRAERREMIMKPDTWQHIKIKVEDQETLVVSIFEEETGHLLVAGDNVYTEKEPFLIGSFPYPQVRLCPRDNIEWRNF